MLLLLCLPFLAAGAADACDSGEISSNFLQLNTEVKTTSHLKVHDTAAANLATKHGEEHKLRRSSVPTSTLALVLILTAPAVAMVLFYIMLGCRAEPKTPHLDKIHQQAEVKREKLEGNSFPEMLYKKATDQSSKTRMALRVWSEAKGIERSMTYEQLAAAVESGAETLARAGVSPGDRVSFFCKGTLDFYIAFLAVETLSATPVLLNWRQSPENLKGMMEDSGSTFLILGALHDSRADVIANMPKGMKTVFLVDGIVSATCPCSVKQWSFASNGSAYKHISASSGSRQGEAAVFFTSGSTSRPKPVLHTYDTLIWTAENFVLPENTTSTLSFLPNFHVIMTLQNFLIPLARGICSAVHGADDSENITAGLLLKATAALNPDVIDTVPFIMEEWSSMKKDELEPLTRCALVQSGGAPLSTSVAERLLEAGIPVRQHYGQTESPGIQLATVMGAGPSELSIFMPPWKMAKPVLDGEEEGELIIQGIMNSAPGNLLKGDLVPNSSKMEPGVGHRTGDIFRWTTTASGQPGLVHCMRTDDVLLLSTGEMFNPVPMEKSLANFVHDLKDIQVSQCAVLGKNRAAPLLVVELANDRVTDQQKIMALLQPGIDAANAAEVEYARIKTAYVAILIPGKSDQLLPKTAKGNFIRSQSEKLLAGVLDNVEVQAKEAQMAQLTAKALAAGYSDVQSYLAEAGSAELKDVGVDSLGVKMEEGDNLADVTRICDNVKAIVCVSVLMFHWYYFIRRPQLSTDAQNVLFGFTLTSTVQPDNHAALKSLTTAMWIFFLAFGIVDGMQDGPERKLVFFSGRTCAVFFIMVLFKFIRPLLDVCDLASQSIDGNLYNSALISNIWFINLMLYYRVFVRLMQACRIPPMLQVVIASAFIGKYFISWEVEEVWLPVPSWTPLKWVTFYLLDSTSFVIPTYLVQYYPQSVQHSPLSTSLGGANYINWMGISLGNFFQSFDVCLFWKSAYDFYGIAHVLAFYYGEGVVMWLLHQQQQIEQKAKSYLGSQDRVVQMKFAAFFAFGAVVFGMNVYAQAKSEVSECPAQYQWACATIQLTMMCAGALFMFMAAIASPWHLKRMGPCTLGAYVLHRFFPFFQFGWVVDIADAMGRAFSDGPIVVLQLAMLLSWPVIYFYMLGPTLQWLAITPVTGLMNATSSLKNAVTKAADRTQSGKVEKPEA